MSSSSSSTSSSSSASASSSSSLSNIKSSSPSFGSGSSFSSDSSSKVHVDVFVVVEVLVRSPRRFFPLLLPGRERVPVHVSVPTLVLLRERLVLVDLLILEVARQILELGLTLPERIILRLGSTGVILVLAVHVVVALLLVRGGVALWRSSPCAARPLSPRVRPAAAAAGAACAAWALFVARPPRHRGRRSRESRAFAGLRGGIAKRALSCASALRARRRRGRLRALDCAAESSETAETDVDETRTAIFNPRSHGSGFKRRIFRRTLGGGEAERRPSGEATAPLFAYARASRRSTASDDRAVHRASRRVEIPLRRPATPSGAAENLALGLAATSPAQARTQLRDATGRSRRPAQAEKRLRGRNLDARMAR